MEEGGTVRVCIVDDHEIVREGLRVALSNDPDVEVVAEAASAAQALREIRRSLPDLALTDYRLPDMSGDELCARIRADFPSTAVVFLTTYLSEEVVQRAFEAGAAGFVTKAAGLDELRRVLAEVGSGGGRGIAGSSAVVKRLYEAACEHTEAPRLTPQQERVLELAAEGLTYAQIGERLHISESTVRFHVQRLKEKLNVATKAELIAVAIRSALIAPGQDAAVA
jgi:DNA-binding NarL/FixJ family response regulator